MHEHVPHTPRPRDYYKPQFLDNKAGILAWRDIQKVCSSPAEAMDIARVKAPVRAIWVRAMHVTDKGRTPMQEELRFRLGDLFVV